MHFTNASMTGSLIVTRICVLDIAARMRRARNDAVLTQAVLPGQEQIVRTVVVASGFAIPYTTAERPMKSVFTLLLVSLCLPVSAQAPRMLPMPSSSSSPHPPMAASSFRPNEMGCIPIVMYHSIGERGAYDRHGLNIAPATFRKHLEMMYKAHWYPINARDIFLPERLGAVPAGKTPVAITFDDARGSQFRYLKDGRIDPNCAVGILEAFHKKHGDAWPQRATFFMLPASQYNPAPFGDSRQVVSKCQFLVAAGYELGNHSTSHHSLGPMNAARLIWEVGTCTRAIQAIAPGATMDTMCLPYGVAPRDKTLWRYLLTDGTPNSPYNNRGIFLAWGDEAYAPWDKRFDRERIPRIGVDPGYFERTFARLTKSGRLYVSDGDPQMLQLPRALEKHLAPERLGGLRLAFVPSPEPTGKRAAVAQSAHTGVIKRRTPSP
jgi:peptidoglycan/xylan/chitin deacetylase (PgdA/CDA1 family)